MGWEESVQPHSLAAPAVHASSLLPACPATPLAWVQLLYFDRYNRILAPQLRVFDDQRINLRQVDLDFDLN